MRPRRRFIRAVIKRELTSYFSSPTGYVFITLFVFLSAAAAFWREEFFRNNLANLDTLNEVFPYLLIFLVPAITMTSWAEEKRTGTAELLLTLPARDWEVVVGKYLSALAIYTAALAFSLSHVVVLLFLGSPDLGLMLSTYLGYWLMGAALLGVGMLASLLTANLTVAFIVGGVLCAVPVFIHHARVLFTGTLQRLLESLSFIEQFRDLSKGVIPASSVVYFVSFAVVLLLLNVALLGRRHWPSGKDAPALGAHFAVRAFSLFVVVASLTVLSGRLGGRIDVTAGQIHSLSPHTVELIRSLDPEKPVFIQAYLSPDVPRPLLPTRNDIVSLLREFEAIGEGRIHVRVAGTERYSEEAREAEDRFGILPREVVSRESAGGEQEVFLGVAYTCGTGEFVTEFFDPGLPVEYELIRSIRVVANAERKKIGVLETGADLFGGFDFETKRRSSDWSIVSELRKQYEVARVPPGKDYPEDIDVLLAVLPNTLKQEEVERLAAYIEQGGPALVMADPMPAFNAELSPQQTPRNPFQPDAPTRTPADLTPLMDVLGVDWNKDLIVWDRYNPHPRFGSLPPEVVFVSAGNDTARRPFHPEEPVSSGLQEVVVLYGGSLKPAESASTGFTPLLATGVNSGVTEWGRLVRRTIFGIQLSTQARREPDLESHTLAARIEGEGENPVHAIIAADVDMMGEQFFELRRRGVENLNFDNVAFLLNAVDQLAGDHSFIALRKRRPKHRTLEAVEALTRVYEERRLEETQEAEAFAERQLAEAQERLDQAVEELRQRQDLDERTKRIMIANLEKAENRRLEVARANIEDAKERRIERSRAEMESSIRGIQNTIKILAVALPPVPAFALFLLVSWRRLRREKIGVAPDRLVYESR